jgi:NADPH-dependent 2,4-dienoyl-CoA reductase/sulfur reductase-like enzyme
MHAMTAARSSGYSGSIHLVSDTHGPAFNPMLSPYYLKGKMPWHRCFPFGEDIYRKCEAVCHWKERVESLDATNKTVSMAGGGTLHYDRCLVATGARPVVPPVPALRDAPGVFTLRTATQTRIMERAIGSAKKVVVLGASLVGVKVAEILRQRNVGVVLIDVAEQILPHSAHPRAAALLEEYFREKGIDVRLGCSIEGIETNHDGVSCFLPNQTVEGADWIAVCTGIRPNVDFIDPVQVALDKAILVNERMETSAEGLYAAGDVSQGANFLTGKSEWLGLWANGCYQGRTAGLNMAGGRASYPGTISQHVSPLFEKTFVQIGDTNRRGRNIRLISGSDPDRSILHFLVFEDDVLVGVNLINGDSWAGRLRSAVMKRMAWGRYMPDGDSTSFHQVENALNTLDHVGRMV